MRQRTRNLNKKVNVNGVIVEVTTALGLSRIVGKSKDTILRYEELEVFPPAPFMKGSVRYYPISLCKRLIPLVKRIPGNRKADADLIMEINKVFKEETERLCQKKE